MQLRIFTFLHDKDEQTLFVDSEEMIVEMSRAVLGVPPSSETISTSSVCYPQPSG